MQSRGSVYRPCYTDRRGTKRESKIHWLRFTVNGQLVRKSTGTTDRDEALAKLEAKLTQFTSTDVTLGTLAKLVRDDYQANGYTSVRRIKQALGHVLGHFGERKRVEEITSTEVQGFIRSRLAEGASRATVNRETGALARAFTLATQQGIVKAKPHMPKLRERNARTGFVERVQLERILPFLPEHLRPAIRVAFITGWRTHSELLPMKWGQVDFERGWIRLEPGNTKNRDGREFPMIPELRSILEVQRKTRSEFVFHHRNGRRILTPKKRVESDNEASGTSRCQDSRPQTVRREEYGPSGHLTAGSDASLWLALVRHASTLCDCREHAARRSGEEASSVNGLASAILGLSSTHSKLSSVIQKGDGLKLTDEQIINCGIALSKHEAGHATMGHALGLRVGRMVISPNEEVGRVLAKATGIGTLVGAHTAVKKGTYLEKAAISMAGQGVDVTAAESLVVASVMGLPSVYHISLKEVGLAFANLCERLESKSQAEAFDVLKSTICPLVARTLVQNRTKIEALAIALLARKSLTEEDILKILGPYPKDKLTIHYTAKDAPLYVRADNFELDVVELWREAML